MAYDYTPKPLKQYPELKRVVQCAFPNYRKLGCYAGVFSPTSINSYWDGGSRDEYALVELASMRRVPLPTRTHPYFDVASRGIVNAENEALSVDYVGNITLKMLLPGYALVSAGTFCGKPATARIAFHPDDLTRALPAGV